jgi:hypothetical protein
VVVESLDSTNTQRRKHVLTCLRFANFVKMRTVVDIYTMAF